MKITAVESIVLQYPLEEELGYSQQYYTERTAHLVRVETDEGVCGIGECFGGGGVAWGNKAIVEKTIRPMILGLDPLDREVIWQRVYNLLRDHGQKGMPIQALSGIDIALWDIAGKVAGLPLHKLVGGAFRERIPAYGYGMMLQRVPDLEARFSAEASALIDAGFRAVKMKVGLGIAQDLKLVEAVRRAIGDDRRLMVDANHCYTAADAMEAGRGLEALGVYWFEEPVAPEDRRGYRALADALDIRIAGGEAEFTRFGFRDLIEARAVDILQPEACGLGGISEYLKVRTLAHSHLLPVVNHVWGSAVAVAMNLHLLAAMPDLPGGAHPPSPMLEYDTTPNRFREELLEEPLGVLAQVRTGDGMIQVPNGPGLGIALDEGFVRHFRVDA